MRIAITGLWTPLGRQLVQRLCALDDPPTLLGLDRAPPLRTFPHFRFHRVDLTEPTADRVLGEILREEGADVVVHLAFRPFPSRDVAFDHELETLGTLHLLSACADAGVHRLVIESSTMVYGSRPDNPNLLDESHPLRGHPGAHQVQNRLEAEELVADWGQRHPEVESTVLRHCWVMGPSYFDRVVEFFEAVRIPTVLGWDPLLQFVHEEDLLHAFERSIFESHPGVFNIVGRGVAPLSTLVALAGKRQLALPKSWLYRTSWLKSQRMSGDPPEGFFDYLRYLWVADGAHGWREFGEPVYSTREAWSAFVGSRRLRHHA